MQEKVICAVLVYGKQTYHEGDCVDIENEAERQMLIQERCIAKSQMVQTKTPIKIERKVKKK